MSAGKFLSGFVVGGAVGAIIGLLLAPQEGEKTRQILAEKSKEMCEKAQGTASDLQSRADIIVDDLQRKGDEIMEKIQNLINRQKPENFNEGNC